MHRHLIRFWRYSKRLNQVAVGFYRIRIDELSNNDVDWLAVSAG